MPTSATLDFFSQLGAFLSNRCWWSYLSLLQSSICRSWCYAKLHFRSKHPSSVITEYFLIIKSSKLFYYLHRKSGGDLCKKCVNFNGRCTPSNLGSNGSGFSYSRMFQHSTIPLCPCLVPIESNIIDKSLKGVRTHCKVSMYKVINKFSMILEKFNLLRVAFPAFQFSNCLDFWNIKQIKWVYNIHGFFPRNHIRGSKAGAHYPLEEWLW